MRTIIAGSRDCTDKRELLAALAACNWTPTTVISGTARGADRLGEMWAAEFKVPCERFPADWDRYGKAAGYRRNEQMAANAEALIPCRLDKFVVREVIMDRMQHKRYWIDKQGNKYLISKMSDSHLVNTIKMLERGANHQAANCYFPIFQGEMAQYLAEQAFDTMQEDPIEFFLSRTVYDKLLDEALKRGLSV